MKYIFGGIFLIGIGIMFWGLVRMWKEYKEVDDYQRQGVLTPEEAAVRLMRVGENWIIVMIGIIICICVIAFINFL